MNAQEEIERGGKAQRLIDDEMYIESMAGVREAIIKQWEACPIRDKEGQHELKLMLKLLSDLQANIKTIADTGKLAQINIEREKSLLRRVTGF
jgi:hypothetical protein